MRGREREREREREIEEEERDDGRRGVRERRRERERKGERGFTSGQETTGAKNRGAPLTSMQTMQVQSSRRAPLALQRKGGRCNSKKSGEEG
jgi:hypothetical protein